MAPTRADLQAAANRALEHLDTEGQATVWWERRLAVGEHGISDIVQHTAEIVVLHDGRVGAASTTVMLSPFGTSSWKPVNWFLLLKSEPHTPRTRTRASTSCSAGPPR